MNIIKLNENIKIFPSCIKEIFWKFIRGDLVLRDFESWIYTSHELQQVLTDQSYLNVVMIDYTEISEVTNLRKDIYKILICESEKCLCLSLPNNTRLYPFWYKHEKDIFLGYLERLKLLFKIENFKGKPPIHQSRWYHSAEISECCACKTKWFIILEESDLDYYLIRLEDDHFQSISSNPDWPNERWPFPLKNWDMFIKVKFSNWHDIYGAEHFNFKIVDNQ